jgi:hypothetical protein
VQTFTGLHSSPSGVPGGSAGLATDDAGLPLPVVALTALGLGVAALGARRLTVGNPVSSRV